jgi:hypothetical protein
VLGAIQCVVRKAPAGPCRMNYPVTGQVDVTTPVLEFNAMPSAAGGTVLRARADRRF